LGAGQLAARAVMFFFGGNELIGFQRGDYGGQVFAADFSAGRGIELWFHL
jgi:hypothetical protein